MGREFDSKLKKYEIALATRNFEIELFWKRSIFFWGFIASSFVGYTTVFKDSPSLSFIISCFGFVCSVAWGLVNRGSKYWQENWESIVAEIEDDITGELFKSRSPRKTKGIWLSSRKFSVSKVTIALSDFTVLVWLGLMLFHVINSFQITLCDGKSLLILLAFLFSIIFVFFMIACGRSSDA